jgi:phosphatidylinositol-3-phosphatase
MKAIAACAWLPLGAIGLIRPSAAAGWRPARVVVVVLENRSFDQVVGDREMPYLNALASGGALMTRAYFAQAPYGLIPTGHASYLPARPSQPNYLYLFSGHNQGVLPSWFQSPGSPYTGTARNDAAGNKLPSPVPATPIGIGNNLIPANLRPFATPNLGAALIESGRSFASFSESLPYPRYDEANDPSPIADLYRRKHNPAINWIDLTRRGVAADKRRFLLPVEANLAFANTADPADGTRYRGFAVDADGTRIGFDRLPTVSIVVPNEQHDLHSGSKAACDAWLAANIKPYADWARDHDSLLIVTFDEDGSTNSTLGDAYRTGIDPILTLFYGPPDKVIPGRYDEIIDHLNVLATLLDRYGLLDRFRRDFAQAHPGEEAERELANLRPILDVFGEGPKLAPIEARRD